MRIEFKLNNKNYWTSIEESNLVDYIIDDELVPEHKVFYAFDDANVMHKIENHTAYSFKNKSKKDKEIIDAIKHN